MITLRRLFVSATMCWVLCLSAGIQFSGTATAQTPAQTPRLPTAAQVHIDLFRGLAGVFSRGMDTLAGRLNRQGYTARVFAHGTWRTAARRIADGRARGERHIIVLIGHSLGGNAVLLLARELDRSNIPVELVVVYDATSPQPVSRNVLHVVNFFQNNGFGRSVSGGPGFQGKLENIDLTADRNLSHTTIDESTRLHDKVIARIVEIVNQDLAGKIQPATPKTTRRRR
jgi:hypothetical protein